MLELEVMPDHVYWDIYSALLARCVMGNTHDPSHWETKWAAQKPVLLHPESMEVYGQTGWLRDEPAKIEPSGTITVAIPSKRVVCKRVPVSGHGRDAVALMQERRDPAGFALRTHRFFHKHSVVQGAIDTHGFVDMGRFRNDTTAYLVPNKSVLASTCRETKSSSQYVACCQGKIVIEVPPFYYSHECATAAPMHQDNQYSQNLFVCLSGGYIDHTYRSVRLLLFGNYGKKEKKRCAITRIKVGAERSKPVVEIQPMCVETELSCLGSKTQAYGSTKCEISATSHLGI